MGTNFSEDTIFNQIQGGNVGYLISIIKALPAYVRFVPVVIAIVTRATLFLESVGSTV